jgi:hypothetical protein
MSGREEGAATGAASEGRKMTCSELAGQLIAETNTWNAGAPGSLKFTKDLEFIPSDHVLEGLQAIESSFLLPLLTRSIDLRNEFATALPDLVLSSDSAKLHSSFLSALAKEDLGPFFKKLQGAVFERRRSFLYEIFKLALKTWPPAETTPEPEEDKPKIKLKKKKASSKKKKEKGGGSSLKKPKKVYAPISPPPLSSAVIAAYSHPPLPPFTTLHTTPPSACRKRG